LEDVVNTHQRAKLEEYDDHLFVVLRVPLEFADFRSEQLTLFLGGDYLLSFQEKPSAILDPVRARLRAGRGRIRNSGPDYLAYAIIDVCLDAYFPVLERCGERVEALEQAVLEQPDDRVIAGIHAVKRELLAIRRALWPQREMLNGLIRDESPLISERTRVYLRDCYDHVIQLIDLVETYREIASSLVDIYLSSVSSRLNEVMKVLTIIATIFIPLGFIASLYGMNFDRAVSPLNMPELGWYFGYPLVLLIMCATVFGLLYYFRRRGWLGRRTP
jgi:magnesium transporter